MTQLEGAHARNKWQGAVKQPHSPWQVGESPLARLGSARTGFAGSGA